MTDAPQYLFAVCQRGAEGALKVELARDWPDFRLAYSKPGFVTFKLPADHGLADDFDLHSALARTYGFSLGKLEGQNALSLAEQAWRLAEEKGTGVFFRNGPERASQKRPPSPFRHLHVWQVDAALPGARGFEPGETPLALETAQIIAAAQPDVADDVRRVRINKIAKAGDLVLDCVLVTPSEWWIGFHRASAAPSRWPGGVPRAALHEAAVNRAYLKMQEALAWSRLPIKSGEAFVEIGSAPGGAAQALLERGLNVTGVDPNEMDPGVLAHPQFTHIKKRGADVRRRDYAPFRWLAADANVAPQQTLDTVEAIVTHDSVNIRGLLLTLKLADWNLAEEIPAYIERIRSWGYQYVKARQLAFNRQEICIMALRRRSMRRKPKKKMKKKAKQ